MVVTPIGFAPKDARDFYVDYVPREWFVTPENFSHATHDINDTPPGVETDTPLGYDWEHQPLGWPLSRRRSRDARPFPRLRRNGQEDEPAARFGNLAMAATVPIKHPWGFTRR